MHIGHGIRVAARAFVTFVKGRLKCLLLLLLSVHSILIDSQTTKTKRTFDPRSSLAEHLPQHDSKRVHVDLLGARQVDVIPALRRDVRHRTAPSLTATSAHVIRELLPPRQAEIRYLTTAAKIRVNLFTVLHQESVGGCSSPSSRP